MTHLVDAHQHPVDQSYRHHLLQVLYGRVLVDLLHDELGDKFGNVPLKRMRGGKKGVCTDVFELEQMCTTRSACSYAAAMSAVFYSWMCSYLFHPLHATQMHDPQHDGGLHTEQDEEVHCLSQEPLQRGGDGVLTAYIWGRKKYKFDHLNVCI